MIENNGNIDFEFRFSDITILETEGSYQDVKAIMDKIHGGKTDWMISSELTIESSMSMCQMTVDFYGDESVYIMDYQTTSGDVYYNPDLQILSMWARQNGWKTPQPAPDLVRANLEFWKHFWETRILDSEYLDKRLGERNIMFPDDYKEEDKDD
jgi:hypothetical protein